MLDINTGSWSRILPSGDPGASGKLAWPTPREGAAAFSHNKGLVGQSRDAFSDTIVRTLFRSIPDVHASPLRFLVAETHQATPYQKFGSYAHTLESSPPPSRYGLGSGMANFRQALMQMELESVSNT